MGENDRGGGEPGIPDLLNGLADLARDAREAGAPEPAVVILECTRERLRYLLGEPGLGTGSQERSGRLLASPEELAPIFAEMVETATEAGAPAWITNLLTTAHMRLTSELHGVGSREEQRLAPRSREDQSARLRRANGLELAVTVMDRSPLGLGLLSDQALDAHELVILTLEGAGGGRRHGEVIFCLQRGDHAFHIGVELLAWQ